MKTLIVFYSRSGSTEQVAQALADKLEADLEMIQDHTHRRGLVGFLRCGYEAVRKRTPQIDPPRQDPSTYDLVIIGTPIWAGRMCSPVRSYMQEQGSKFKQLAVFCISSSGGYDGVPEEIASVGHSPLVGTLLLKKNESSGTLFNQAIEGFVDQLTVS